MQTQVTFRAEYTDGESARLQSAVVTLASGHVEIQLGNTRIRWPFEELHVDPSLLPLTRITRKGFPLAAVTVHDPHFAAGLQRAKSGLGRFHLGRRGQLLGLAALVVILISGVWMIITPVSKRIAHKIPFKWEQEMSSKFVENFKEKDCGDLRSNQVLAALQTRLVGPVSLPFETHFMLVKDDEVNAFALPGGLIIINRGLVAKSDTPDELAGVVAHELQHIVQRHITASLVRSGLLTGLWHITLGDFTGVLAADPHTIMQVASLQFDRQAESDADQGAIKMLDRAKISRAGFEAFFRKAEGEGKQVPAWMSSHPSHKDRIGMLRKTSGPEATSPSLSSLQWKVLKDSCPKSVNEDDNDDE